MPKPDIGRKITIFAPVRGSPLEYCHNLWYRKTRMVWLPDGERIGFDRIHMYRYTNVADKETDGHCVTEHTCIATRTWQTKRQMDIA